MLMVLKRVLEEERIRGDVKETRGKVRTKSDLTGKEGTEERPF